MTKKFNQKVSGMRLSHIWKVNITQKVTQTDVPFFFIEVNVKKNLRLNTLSLQHLTIYL